MQMFSLINSLGDTEILLNSSLNIYVAAKFLNNFPRKSPVKFLSSWCDLVYGYHRKGHKLSEIKLLAKYGPVNRLKNNFARLNMSWA